MRLTRGKESKVKIQLTEIDITGKLIGTRGMTLYDTNLDEVEQMIKEEAEKRSEEAENIKKT